MTNAEQPCPTCPLSTLPPEVRPALMAVRDVIVTSGPHEDWRNVAARRSEGFAPIGAIAAAALTVEADSPHVASARQCAQQFGGSSGCKSQVAGA